MRWLLLLVGLTGCHKLFDLEVVPNDVDDARPGGDSQVDDAHADDAAADAAPDAAGACPSVLMYDEDGDGIDNSCDACPTVSSNTADADGDGLPNACDPNLAAGDRILFVATFAESSDFFQLFTLSGAVSFDSTANGRLNVDRSTVLTTVVSLPATRIVVRLEGISPTLGTFSVGSSSLSCVVQGSDCEGQNTAATGVTAVPGGSCGELGVASSLVTEVWFAKSSGGLVCQMVAGGSTGSSLPAASFMNSQITLATNAAAQAVIASVVVYGAK